MELKVEQEVSRVGPIVQIIFELGSHQDPTKIMESRFEKFKSLQLQFINHSISINHSVWFSKS